jgi:hypothetical protein
MRPSRVVLAATVVGSPPLFSAAVCSVAASMAAIDLMLVYRVVPAWPTRVGLGHHRDNFVIPITRFSQPVFPTRSR